MPVSEHAGSAYDFLAEENYPRWYRLLQPFLKGVLHEVHPHLDIDSEALTYLEKLLYQLLHKICSTCPVQVQDVKDYVQENYPNPVNEWAVQEAEGSMDKIATRRKKGPYALPLDRIHHQLVRDALGHKVDLSFTCFVLGVLDYVAADALKVAGNFIKNTRDRSQDNPRGGVIQERDLRVSINVDQALSDLFEFDSDHDHGIIVEPTVLSDPQSMKHEDYVKQLNSEEMKYLRHLKMLIKIYKETLKKQPDLFSDKEIELIFGNIDEVFELTLQLYGMIEDSLEMVGDGGDQSKGRCPQLGACFADLAMNDEFTVYSTYAEHIHMALGILKDISRRPNMDSLTALQPNVPLFKEAVVYVLPKHLLQPIYHCFYYFDIIQALMKTTTDNVDYENFSEAYSAMLGLKGNIERAVIEYPPKRRDDLQKATAGYHANVRKLTAVQRSIEMWEGPSIRVLCTEFLMEGTLGFMKEASRTTKRTDRHVILLDGLIICCKPNTRRSGSGNVTPEWRLKEKLNLRKAELKDLESTEFPDSNLAFELKERNQPGYIFIAGNVEEKIEWMACLTNLLSRSSFDRLLDMIARTEERNIKEIRPLASEYRFAEEDSEDNIVFEPQDDNVSGIPLIKGGTLLKLVERLTHHKYADPAFVRIFLTTYRSFCNPSELLTLLIERFNVSLPSEFESSEPRRDPLVREAIRRFKRQYQSPIQLRVLNAIRYWVEHHFYDFQDNEDGELLKMLLEFMDSIKSNNLKKWTESIRRTLQRQKEGSESTFQMDSSFYIGAPSIEWHLSRDPAEFDLLTLHPLEIARQLTLTESEYFRAIHPSELVGCAWVKSQKEVTSPNYLRMVRHSTAVTYWLEKQIVSAENFDERVAIVTRCCDMYLAFQDLYNFNGMFEVHAALNSASVYRLEHTFRALTPRRHMVLQEGKELIENHYKKYKERLRSINPPCVPFLGMYLSDILFIEEGGKHIISGTKGLINFGYRRKVAEVIGEIQQYQNQPYCLQQVPSIQNYFQKISPMDGFKSTNELEDYLYKLSGEIEPKNQLPKKAPRKSKWDLKSPGHKPSKQEVRKRNQSVPSVLESDGVLSPPSPNAPMSPNGLQKKSATMLDSPSTSVVGARRSSDIGSSPKPKQVPGSALNSFSESLTSIKSEDFFEITINSTAPPLPPKPPVGAPPLPEKGPDPPVTIPQKPILPPLPPREPRMDLPPPVPPKEVVEPTIGDDDNRSEPLPIAPHLPPPVPPKELVELNIGDIEYRSAQVPALSGVIAPPLPPRPNRDQDNSSMSPPPPLPPKPEL